MLLFGGQGSISLEYQIYTSAHPFDTLVTGMGWAGHIKIPWKDNIIPAPWPLLTVRLRFEIILGN